MSTNHSVIRLFGYSVVHFNQGFTLIEMLVVIGIIAILIAASIAGFMSAGKTAEAARTRELVANTATALGVLLQNKGQWPQRMAAEAQSGDGKLDQNAAAALGYHGYMSLSGKANANGTYTLTGADRFGIVDPWAMAVVKRYQKNGGSPDSIKVPSGGTVKDHTLHFALDLDGDGIVNASVGGTPVDVRANAIVWSCGRDGVVSPYPYAGGNQSGGGGANKGNATGHRSDDIYSWHPKQVVK